MSGRNGGLLASRTDPHTVGFAMPAPRSRCTEMRAYSWPTAARRDAGGAAGSLRSRRLGAAASQDAPDLTESSAHVATADGSFAAASAAQIAGAAGAGPAY